MRKKTLAVIIGAVIGAVGIAGYYGYEQYNHTERDSVPDSSANPVSGSLTDHVLNSPADITDELISKIIRNDINSLTINYEFTRCQNFYDEKMEDWNNNDRLLRNPFWIANRQKPLTHINFKVKLSPNVHSLACAFYGMEELEFVNLEDTSNVTDM